MTLEQKRSFRPQFGPQISFLEVPALLDVRHCPKLQSCAMSRKTYDATLKTGKKPNLGPNLGPPKSFSWVLPLLNVRQCSKLSPYAMSKKTNEPNLKKRQKLNFGPHFGSFLPKFGPPNFFCRFYLFQQLDMVPSYHFMQFTGKLVNQTWKNGKKNLILGLILVRFGPNLVPKFFFRGFYLHWMLYIVTS